MTGSLNARKNCQELLAMGGMACSAHQVFRPEIYALFIPLRHCQPRGKNENQTRKKLLSRIFPSIVTPKKNCWSPGDPIGRSGWGTPFDVFLAEGVTGCFRRRFLVLQQPKIYFDS
jgi:hypothetical protein